MAERFIPAAGGDVVVVRGIECRVFKTLPCGTVDVEATDGSERCFRLSGCLIRTEVRRD